MNVYSLADEIADTRMERPHVVILGSGASRAAFPKGDRHGRSLPLMADLVQTLDLKSDLRAAQLRTDPGDFEGLYDEIAGRSDLVDLRSALEDRIAAYFSALEMPEGATLYDRLVCSLRPKDVIATFNWDPFLFDAMARNRGLGKLPRLRFLHGCVRLGVCTCGALGNRDNPCHKCGKRRTPMPLLFPIAKKNYSSHPVIAHFWQNLKDDLRSAYILTIFGYGAPSTDVEAVSLMGAAWGLPAERSYEEIEIVDIRERSDLERTWSPFTFSHHYQVQNDYSKSLIACHPRRSCEVLFAQLMDIQWVQHTAALPEGGTLDQLHEHLASRLLAET